MHLVFCFFLLLSLVVPPVSGIDVPLARITDDTALRLSVKDTWLLESPGKVLSRPRVQYRLAGGGKVELRTETGREEFMVILAREHNNTFPGWAQGSWILTRRKDSGAASRIRVFPRSDPNTYIQFRHFSADKCLMDVVIYDAFAVHSLPLPVHLERLYTMPLTEVLDLAGSKFPRRYFEPEPDNYREQRLFIQKVREKLPSLRYADDGAIDQQGRYVYIETGMEQTGQKGLNCSGFAKWLVDGMLKPVSGERLEIPPLKAPFGSRGSTYTETWEELRDPFFGLDWIRNLASQAATILYAPAFGNIDEIVVKKEPFSRIIIRTGTGSTLQSYSGVLEHAGYSIEGLLPLLYTLAIDEPDRFYLAAVNNELGAPRTESNPRGQPRIRQYFHVAALVPYFTENGIFTVAVFESAAETPIKNFISRYPNHKISLVRVPVESKFNP